jgi:hypothetical protein
VPPNYRQQQGKPLSRHERKGAVAVVATVVLVGAGLGIWDLTGGSAGPTPAGPCVSVAVASSTGGGTMRQCGSDARSWCAAEARSTGPVASLAKGACRREGLLAEH